MNKQATFGGGCFWCLEAIFQKVDGVRSVTSGYAGGHTEDPTYREVCGGNTGHAEVVQIEYDPDVVSYADLLEIFWKAHNPTTLNRQGADVGTQYRSIILTHDEQQREMAEKSRESAQAGLEAEIVTEIKPLETFYPAETNHQDYYKRNPQAPYCAFVIAPKLHKLGM